ncbi:MAG: 30S ribosomal protein S8 [Candidatus Omnitrophota bacterium]
MAVTDPIADMLTVIRNANKARIEKIDVPSSKIKKEILRILKTRRYIVDYKHIEDNKQGILRVYLKFLGRERKPVINKIRRISKSSRRIYVNKDEIPRVLRGIGMAILSTNKGIMTDEEARVSKIGGEVLCYIW